MEALFRLAYIERADKMLPSSQLVRVNVYSTPRSGSNERVSEKLLLVGVIMHVPFCQGWHLYVGVVGQSS